VFHAVDEGARQHRRRAGGGDLRNLAEQLTEGHGDLSSGEVGTQAEVGAGGAEPELIVGCAGHIEPQRVFEDRLVPVGRPVRQENLVALVEGAAAERCSIGGDCSTHRDHRRCQPHDLIHSGGSEQLEIALPKSTLIGVLAQMMKAPGDGVASGFVSGNGQQDEERRQLLFCETLAVDLCVHEG